MIIDVLGVLNGKSVVLASASPRRVEMLRGTGLHVKVVPSTFAEDLDKSQFRGGDLALENARRKAREVYDRLASQGTEAAADIVIGADTVVVLGGEIIEKPKDADDAKRILAKLSGNRHSVFTGVAVLWRDCKDGGTAVRESVATEETVVEFDKLSDAAIAAYVATGSPLDKAGAYGIQDGVGGTFIRGIRGCYFNVVGLPLHTLSAILRDIAEKLK